jgi:hypothetical protein
MQKIAEAATLLFSAYAMTSLKDKNALTNNKLDDSLLTFVIADC